MNCSVAHCLRERTQTSVLCRVHLQKFLYFRKVRPVRINSQYGYVNEMLQFQGFLEWEKISGDVEFASMM
jgi:hypothetical protein